MPLRETGTAALYLQLTATTPLVTGPLDEEPKRQRAIGTVRDEVAGRNCSQQDGGVGGGVNNDDRQQIFAVVIPQVGQNCPR